MVRLVYARCFDKRHNLENDTMAVSKKDLSPGEEHGAMQHLGSPILSKIQQAFMYIRAIALGEAQQEFATVRAVEGRRQ